MADIYRERMRVVRALAEANDVPGLVGELVRISGANEGRWGYESRRITTIVGALDRGVRAEVATAVFEKAGGLTDPEHRASALGLVTILAENLGPQTPPPIAEMMLEDLARQNIGAPVDRLLNLAQVLERAGRPLSPEVVAVVRRTATGAPFAGAELKKFAKTLTDPPLNVGEAWADRVDADLSTLDARWARLVAHAATATSARPSEAWSKKAVELLAEIPGDAAGETLRGWLSLVGRPRTRRLERGEFEHEVNESFDPFNANPLRGLVWLTAHVPGHPDTARVLGALVETALRRVAGLGPRSPKTANAAVHALAGLGTEAALAQIARLTTKVTVKATVKELDAALEAVARSLNLARDEVEELAVPTYGLTDVGRRVERFGEATAVVEVSGGRAVVSWSNATGRAVKAPPAAVRTDHAAELAELKATAKDLDQMLSAQADRLDRQFLAQRVWLFGAWRERYLDHPLLGTLARRLIWLVDDCAVGFADGALRDVDDKAVDDKAVGDGSEVRLWHPIGRAVDEVVAWRAWLERHGVTQPFKQAHREVYLLTAAEERTATYSNRFAAHILRQHQFHALAAVRGWRNQLRLMVDDSYPPATREVPGFRAEFWVEGIGENYGEDTTEAGTFLRVATDQVRFHNPDDEPVPLTDVPPLVFSEVMRDVDLFVGVASVGNDPTWQDGGPQGRFRDYWAEYSFGELTATAQTRRELLERLVPRLAVAERATVAGRFLEVRGNLRTYRIHLGSGNILMSPDDRYLCIVPKQATESTGPVFLPFEGDRVLALILSKALLLARDDQITDRSIVSQIRY